MRISVVTSPALEPLTLEELKDHLRVTWDTEDAHINALQTAARQWSEAFTRRQFITATYKLTLPTLVWKTYLPRPPLQAVSSIAYIDVDGVSQTLDPSLYEVDTEAEPGVVHKAYNATLPSTRSVWNAVQITFIAGYGGREDVPQAIKQAVLMLVEHYYRQRSATTEGTVSSIPLGVKSLLTPYRTGVLDPHWFAV